MADVNAGTKWSVASNPISRRRFVKGVIGGLAGGVLAVVAASELHLIPTQFGRVIDQPSPWQLLDQLGRSSFDKHLGEDFWIHHDLFAIVPTRLVEVSASGLSNSVSQAGADEKHFTLVFEGPHEQPLSQKTYLFQHPMQGTFLCSSYRWATAQVRFITYRSSTGFRPSCSSERIELQFE